MLNATTTKTIWTIAWIQMPLTGKYMKPNNSAYKNGRLVDSS